MLKYAPLTCAIALSVLGLHAQAVVASQNIQTTGMIGIASGQTAQLNLLNPGIQAPAMGVLCTATVSFVDAGGKVLKSATLTVIPGQSQSFALKSDTDLNLIAGERNEIRATIAIPFVPPPNASGVGPAAAGCRVIPTLEMIDTVSGRTLVTLGHVTAIPALFEGNQPRR